MIPPNLAPISVAVFPLMKKDGLLEEAKTIHSSLNRAMRGRWVAFDEKGAIGRRYRRNDSIGTPFCLTIDHQTLQDGTATLRERDSMNQTRVDVRNVNKLGFELEMKLSNHHQSLDGLSNEKWKRIFET